MKAIRIIVNVVWLLLVVALLAANVAFALLRWTDGKKAQDGLPPTFTLKTARWMHERLAPAEAPAAAAEDESPEGSDEFDMMGPPPDEMGEAPAAPPAPPPEADPAVQREKTVQKVVVMAMPMLGALLPVLLFAAGFIDGVRAGRKRGWRPRVLLLWSIVIALAAAGLMLANTASTFLIYEGLPSL